MTKTRPGCGGAVSSLTGHVAILTGKFHLDGKHITQREAASLLVLSGVEAVVEGSRNRSVTLLVHGDLSASTVKDPVRRESIKLKWAHGQREAGNHICIVDEVGLSELLKDRSAPCLISRSISEKEFELQAELPPQGLLGAVLQRRRSGTRAAEELSYDLSHLDRATAAHEDVLQELKLHIEPDELCEPPPGGPPYDAGWLGEGAGVLPRLFIVEAKSLTGAREEQQIRLGIGQLLDYVFSVRSGSDGKVEEVVPVLLLQHEPSDPRWKLLCDSLGVILTYPPSFPGVASQRPRPELPEFDFEPFVWGALGAQELENRRESTRSDEQRFRRSED